MLAAPISIPANTAGSGPRPINLQQDADAVLKLLDITFGPIKVDGGHRQIGDRVSITLDPPLLYRLTHISNRFYPGFVWEEDGQIVANITLVKSQVSGRFLIANVAVHPDYRRRGIGRRLMEEIIDYVKHLNGKDIFLQVRRDNKGAVGLYHSLDFAGLGVMNQWEVLTSQIRLKGDPNEKQPHIRRLKANEWRSAYELDKFCLNPDLAWPIPLSTRKYNRGLWTKIDDFLNAQRWETWVVEEQNSTGQNPNFAGLINLQSEWRRPLRIELRVKSGAREYVRQALFNKGAARIKKWRTGVVRIAHPAEDNYLNTLLSESNFSIKESLMVMRLPLS